MTTEKCKIYKLIKTNKFCYLIYFYIKDYFLISKINTLNYKKFYLIFKKINLI